MLFFKKNCLMILVLLIAAGCKQEGADGEVISAKSAELPASISNTDNKQSGGGCSVATVSGGAQITCGETTAFVANGSNSAPQKIPVLYDGNVGNNPGGQYRQIGDYLISITKSQSTELITVWFEKEQAVLQYENGIVSPHNTAVFYNSNDCSGDGIYQTNPDVHSFAFGMGNRIIFWDRYYRLNNDKVVHCYPRSKREIDGTCTELATVQQDFNGFIAKPADVGVTTVLSSGYTVKLK